MSSNVFTVLGNAILLRPVLEMLGQLTVDLENNPVVMNDLAHRLGVSKKLSFFDVYSLDDPELLALVPRPVFALLAIIPFTDAWEKIRLAEDDRKDWYCGAGADEPVVWFKQTITHGCGLIGFLHCVCNGLPAEMINPGSELHRFLDKAIPLKMEDRANLLSGSETFYLASEAAALNGDTKPPKLEELEKLGQHFVAFVKARDGHLWELEGSRKGPIDRGALGENDDALSEKALEQGLKRLINIERDSGGDLRFSCIALAAGVD